jgi:hypothetical protein
LRYTPENLPKEVDYTKRTQRENELITLCRSNKEHRKRGACALYRDMPAEQGWLDRWRTRRLRRFREEWAKDPATQI